MTLLTARQVAEQLAVSQRFVYDLAARGELPVVRLGGAVRFEPQDVEAYRTSCRSTGTRQSAAGVSIIKVRSPDGESELASYFRKAGIARQPRLSTRPKSGASMKLVSSRK